MSKYKKWHDNIIARAHSRGLDGYVEKHHIVPKSLGGDNSKSNIVRLTAREHFLIHWLLTKIETGKNRDKMVHAFWRMCNYKRHVSSSWQFEVARKNHSELIAVRNKTAEQRTAVSRAKTGVSRPPSVSEAISVAKKGKPSPFTSEIKTSISRKLKGRKPWNTGKQLSSGHRAKLSVASSGRKLTKAERDKISKAHTGRVFSAESRKRMSVSAKRRCSRKAKAEM